MYKRQERYFTHAFDFKNYVRGQHLYNAACVASLAGHKAAAFWFLEERMKAEPEWYSLNIETDKDLLPIHEMCIRDSLQTDTPFLIPTIIISLAS